MLKARRPAWLTIGIIILALLLNVIIIKSAYTDNQLFWMLIVSIPLLIITVYDARQTGHFLHKYFTDSIQPSIKHNHLQWSHSIYPTKIASTDLEVRIGNEQCGQPYNTCILNVGGVNYRNPESIFIQPQDEKEIEPSEYSVGESFNMYHLAAGGLVWQIASDYLGCRDENGHFNSEKFRKTACRPEVRMIELKLSSAIKPIYRVDSFLDSVHPIKGKIHNAIFSNSAFTTFRDAEGMIHFLNNLRELSDGKPVGIRLCINDKKEFYQICHSVKKAQLIPDFIVIEDSFERAGILHSDQNFYIGTPLYEALLFVSQTLQMYGLQKEIKVIADGRITSCFDIIKVIALGADLVYTRIPRYTSIKYPGNGEGFTHHYKTQNEHDFHNMLLVDTIQLMSVCGFKSVNDITLSKFLSGLDVLQSKSFEELIRTVLCPASVKKMNTSKIKHHRPLEEMKNAGVSQ